MYVCLTEINTWSVPFKHSVIQLYIAVLWGGVGGLWLYVLYMPVIHPFT